MRSVSSSGFCVRPTSLARTETAKSTPSADVNANPAQSQTADMKSVEHAQTRAKIAHLHWESWNVNVLVTKICGCASKTKSAGDETSLLSCTAGKFRLQEAYPLPALKTQCKTVTGTNYRVQARYRADPAASNWIQFLNNILKSKTSEFKRIHLTVLFYAFINCQDYQPILRNDHGKFINIMVKFFFVISFWNNICLFINSITVDHEIYREANRPAKPSNTLPGECILWNARGGGAGESSIYNILI